ncbi:MAG TPA: hypothetical protein PKZ76_09550 [Xanthomonadaceae bacterium]|nr:hypothetical protein [Xanthomonadaceae bacterium]
MHWTDLRRSWFLLLPVLAAPEASAFSTGSPICEVHTLPLIEMSETLANPPPQGWHLRASRRFFHPELPLRIEARNPNGTLLARGILLWARSGPASGAGHFELPASGRFQYIPAGAGCDGWALSHTDGLAKAQSEMRFDWIPGDHGTAVIGAFLIQDCPEQAGGCRDQQALTELLVIERGLFADGFEP